MKKLCILAVLLLVAALLVACGEPAATEPPTQAVTEAPTDPPTVPPTDPPTEPPTEPLEPITGYHFSEPDGFIAAATTEILSVIVGPDGDGTNISIMSLNTGMDFSELTDENFAENLGIVADEGTETVLHTMEPAEVDGYPAYLLDYTLTTSGVTVRTRSYFVTDNAHTYAFMFADATADGAWADEFAASAATINLLVEGEVIPVDTDGLKLYDLGCGLSMYAMPGLETFEDEELAAYLENEDAAIMVYEYNKSEYGLYGLSLDDFLSVFVDGEIITGFEKDPYGNSAAAFLDEGMDGNQYFYYMVGYNTADTFWLVECACNADQAAVYVEDFAQWSATITETE